MESYFQRFVVAGGITMVALIPLSVIAVTLIFAGLFGLRRGRIMPSDISKAFVNLGESPSIETLQDSLQKCADGPLRRICIRLLPWICRHGESWDLAVQQVSSEEMAGLYEKHGYLSLIYQVAPLLGLLGTILGMISAFHQFEINENRSMSELGKGISEALITTMWGLMIAIPSQFFLSFFRQKIYRYEEDFVPTLVRDLFSKLPKSARLPATPHAAESTPAPAPADSRPLPTLSGDLHRRLSDPSKEQH